MNKQYLINYWTKTKTITNKKLINAFKKIPREKFIPDRLKSQAYDDNPLPIGSGQTISQPTTIMMMLQALELKKGDKVLEIGTGSGYNAALIAEITKTTVYTIEILPELVKTAKENLKKAKIKNVKSILSDGSLGYEKEKPYNAIIITAASPEIPKPLIKQLKNNGRLVAPVGPSYGQNLIKITKKGKALIKENLGQFIFVPLKGKYGY